MSAKTHPQVKIHYSFKKIMTGSDLSRRRLPFMSAVSEHQGPLVWLTACLHGDEVSGIIVIQEIFKRLRRRLLCGSLLAFPLMNPLGFETGSRHITLSEEDLNRSFPGNPNGSLGERIAYRIFNNIIETQPTLVMDLHNDWIKSIPYVLLDHHPGEKHKEAYQQAIKVAQQTGMCLIVDDEELISSLSFNLLLQNIPTITFELGKSYIVSESNVSYGVEAIWNILAHLGMVSSQPSVFEYPLPSGYGQGKLLSYADKPYCSKTGIIRFLAKPGQIVKTGQPLAKIVNAFGRHQETITALNEAIVLGHTDSSAAFPGMHMMAFGRPKKYDL